MQTLTWDVDAAAVANSDAYSLALAKQARQKPQFAICFVSMYMYLMWPTRKFSRIPGLGFSFHILGIVFNFFERQMFLPGNNLHLAL